MVFRSFSLSLLSSLESRAIGFTTAIGKLGLDATLIELLQTVFSLSLSHALDRKRKEREEIAIDSEAGVVGSGGRVEVVICSTHTHIHIQSETNS
jgi:hypothetical protein